MTFMHMDATTAAGDPVVVQIQALYCQSVEFYATFTEIRVNPTGDVTCEERGFADFAFNWFEPLNQAPGSPGYQIMRTVAVPTDILPGQGPAAGVWTKLYTYSNTNQTGAVGIAGTGYNVGDKLTLLGGTSRVQSVFNVDTLTGGAGTGVATISLDDEGIYSVAPTVPFASTSTDGGGGGCFLNPNMTSGSVGWGVQVSGIGNVISTFTASIRQGTGPTITSALWTVHSQVTFA